MTANDRPLSHYRLYHRALKLFQDVAAASADEACQAVGWVIGDVWVQKLTGALPAQRWINITCPDSPLVYKEVQPNG